MILSDELFRALTDRPPAADDGRRAAQRVPVTMQAAVVLLSGDTPEPVQMQAQVLDVSPIGVGLALPKSLAKGDLLAVRLRTLADEPFWLVSKIARCIPRPDGSFLIGAHFLRVLQIRSASSDANPHDLTPDAGTFPDFGAPRNIVA